MKQELEPIQIVVDRHDPKIIDGLKNAPLYKKQGEVRAQIAIGGEEVVTTLADGTVETKNQANPGDAIITNPGGEEYIIKGEKFAKRYEPKNGEPGIYAAKRLLSSNFQPLWLSNYYDGFLGRNAKWSS